MENLEFAKLKYPGMRNELLNYLKNLSDHTYQKNAWVSKNYPPEIKYDELNSSIHFLFDDTCLGENPKNAIGVFLYNEQEVFLISNLIKCINNIFCNYGTDLSDASYIEKPEWIYVLGAAKNARSALLKNDAERK